MSVRWPRSSLLLSVALLASTGCMPDLDALRGTPEDADLRLVSETGGKADGEGWEDGSPLEAGVDAGREEGGAPDAFAPPSPRCGVPGTPCCREGVGPACAIGACLRGRCEAFAGLWARPAPLSCAPGGCTVRNPFTAGCSCPEGFDAWPIETLRGPCEGSAGTRAALSIHLCLGSGRLPNSLFGGLWLREGERCRVPDPFTAACRCPEGTERLERAVGLDGNGSGSLGLCLGPGGTEEAFAGVYLLGTDAPGGCAWPNPHTGACRCPEGSAAQWLPLRGPRDEPLPLAICLRSGAGS